MFGSNPASVHDEYENHARSKRSTDPDIFQAKEKCFKTLLKIASLEDDFQFLQNEIEGKALLLSQDKTHTHGAEQRAAGSMEQLSKIHQDCIASVKQNWEWLAAVSKCLPVHLGHAADYQQFFHQAGHLQKSMSDCTQQLEEVLSAESNIPDMIHNIKMLTGNLLQYQHGAEKLAEKAKNIVPLHYRRELPNFPVKVKSLLSFTHGEFSVSEGEECTIVDNSNQISWIVRNEAGDEDELPPIILVLSSLCKEAVDQSSSLRKQTVSLWKTFISRTLRRVVSRLTQMTNSSKAETFQNLSRDDRNEVILTLRDIVNIVPTEKLTDAEYEKLADGVHSLVDIIANLSYEQKGTDSETLPTWKHAVKMAHAYQDVEIYGVHYASLLDSSTASGSVVLTQPSDTEGNKYISSAYIKRVPMSNMTDGEDAEDTLYICEKTHDSYEGDESNHSMIACSRQPIRVTVTTEVDEDVFTVCTVQETTKFVISGVRDPNSDKLISLNEALEKGIIDQQNGLYCVPGDSGQSMTIGEAVAQGKIVVADATTSKDFEQNESEVLKTRIPSVDLSSERQTPQSTYAVTGIMDTKKGKVLTVTQAVRKSIIDPQTGMFTSTQDKSQIIFQEALERGYIFSEKLSGNPHMNGDTTAIDTVEASTGRNDYEVDNVLDPRTKYRVSLPYAISKGIVDSHSGEYRNPETGEYMALNDAVNKGVVKATKAAPGSVKALVNLLQLHDNGSTPVRYMLPHAKQDPNSAAYKALTKHLDSSVKSVINHNGEAVSIREAYQRGLLKFDSLTYVNADGSTVNIEKAAQQGLITMPVIQNILGACRKLSLQHNMDSGRISPDGAKLIDNGQDWSLEEAISCGKLDPYSVYFREKSSGDVITLGHALDTELISPDQANSLEESLVNEKIIPSISVSSIVKEAFVIERLLTDRDVVIKDPSTGKDVPLREAVRRGLYDTQHAEIVDSSAGRQLSLSKAVQEGLILKKDAKALYDAMDKMSLQKAVTNNMLNGEWYNPDTKSQMTLKEAIDEGHLIPETVFFVDQSNGRISTLAAGIEEGKLNVNDGSFLGDVTHHHTEGMNGALPIADAITQKIVSPEIKSWRFIEEEAPLLEFLNAGAVNDKTEIWISTKRQPQIKDALANKLVSLQSLVTMNPQTGELKLVNDSGKLLTPLTEIPEMIDWLADLELRMAKQAKPHENVPGITHQIHELLALQETLSEKKLMIDTLTADSQKLLEQSKPGDRSELEQQQFQQLRIVSSGLKATNEKVHKQMRTQLKRLQNMKVFLEEYKDKHDSFEDWVTHAQAKISGTGTMVADLENLEEHSAQLQDSACSDKSSSELEGLPQQFQNEISQQDTKVLGMQTTSLKFLAEANEYEKAMDAYRQTIHKPLPKNSIDYPEPELQSATDSASERFKKLKLDNLNSRDQVEETMQRAKVFKELHSQISDWLSEADSRLVDVAAQEVDSEDTEAVQVKTDSLNELDAQLAATQKLLDKLDEANHMLISAYTGANKIQKAKELDDKVEALANHCGSFQSKIVSAQQEFNQQLLLSQDLHQSIQGIAEWIKETENEVDKTFRVSLDADKLKEQVLAHGKLESDLRNNAMKLDSLEKRAANDKHLPDLQDRLSNLAEVLDSRGQTLDDMGAKMADLTSDVKSLEDWILSVVQDLQGKAATADPGTIKAHFEELYSQKKSKQPALESLKQSISALIHDPLTCDKNNILDVQSDVCAKWHDFTELLIDLIVMQALRDIEDVNNHFINSEHQLLRAEPVTINAEEVTSQLRDHRIFHEKLETRRDNAMEVIQKTSHMLRETTKEEGDVYKSRIEHVKSLIASVFKLSTDRLHTFEEAVPMVQHFNEHHSDLSTWLEEISSEVMSLGTVCDNAEQIKKQQDTLKTSLRYIDDHRPLVEDINNTGQEVKILCPPEEAAKLQAILDKVNYKYDDVKASIRKRLNSLGDGFRKSTTEVNEAIDGMLNELTHLHNQIGHAQPIGATVDKIIDQIQENKSIMEDTGDRQQAIQGIKASAGELIAKVKAKEADDASDDEDKIKIDVDDIEQKITEMEALNDEIKQKTVARGRSLEEALSAARKFWDIYNNLMLSFKDIQDCINSQDSPQVESVLIQEQDKEHREISHTLQMAIPRLEEVKRMSQNLAPLLGESGKVDISRSVEEADEVCEEIGDILNERQVTLKEAMERASQFEEEIESVLSWLPKLEETLENMGAIALDIRSIKIQIEEVKILKLQAVGKCVAIEGINSSVAALKNKSAVAAENFVIAVEDINNRWNKLVDGIFDREQTLQESLLRLGELDASLEDVNGYLQQVEDDLSQLDEIHGDPKYLETHLKKLKMIQDDLDNQENVVTSLNAGISEMSSKERAADSPRHLPLLEKQQEMNELWKSVNSLMKDKRNKLQEKLTGVKSYLGEIEDVVGWLENFEQVLKAVKTIGALPETAQKQCEKFNEHLTNLNAKNDVAHSLLMTGEEMLQTFNCHPFQTVQIRSSLAKLRRSCDAAKKQAKKKKQKLQEHLQNVTGFHSVMKIFTDWLVNGESNLVKFKHPSKLVEPVEKQMKAHKEFHEDVEAHKEIVDRLDRTGTYLKYYGAKHDAIVIRNQLVSIKLRWKRLLWKTEERGRLLYSAYKEDKRFATEWKSLVGWLDSTKESLHKMVEQKPSPARMKEIIDEIKSFERQIARKHPRYYSTTRLGRNLKDRCTKGDPEREVLHKMLEELRTKWTGLRTEISQKQTQLDDQLLESGRLVEASKSLVDWLEKAQDTLSDEHPTRGDHDTVSSLIEQHKSFQEELRNRGTTLNTLQQTANPEDPAVLETLNHLNHLWTTIEDMSQKKDMQLQDNLKMANEFQTAVNTVRDFLPQADQELKFQPLPEHELAIMQLMERHEKFEAQLQKMVPSVEKIKVLGEEIMASCHPNAVRFVKYYLTITHTRWDQLVERSKARRKRLEDALDDIQGSMSLLEDLIAYLSEAEVLLFTKEDDETPEDLTLVEDLLKQHIEFHEELQEKGKEVEKFTNAQQEPSRLGYLPKLKTDTSIDDNILRIVQRELLDPNNPMVGQLLNKWRSVWKMSVDRKKRLQDYLEHLLEMESVRNFDFELWRQRYLAWIKTKKARITDFFRAQLKNEDGTIKRDDFITGMMESKFPTNKAELNAVFNIFDRELTGSINYREFIEALRPDWMVQLLREANKAALTSGKAVYNRINIAKKPKRQLSEQELVHDEIEREVSTCKCRSQFKFEHIEAGKYRFGDSQKMVLVRFLNSTVMVRVGGGWVTLQKFLENHDPCKAHRTNLAAMQARSRSSVELNSRQHATQFGSMSNLSRGRQTPDLSDLSYGHNSMPRQKTKDGWANWSSTSDLFYDPYEQPERRGSLYAKGRTNTELREQFTLADGTAQTRATFSSRRHASRGSAGSDAGYSSGSSSVGNRQVYGSAECLSATSTPRKSLSSMHRSKVVPAQSMVNLSSTSHYGSNSSLAGRKGSVTPTPSANGGRVTPARRKAATPTPRSVTRTPPPRR